jgi:drug/metabolite transporter (DMT)-like permease
MNGGEVGLIAVATLLIGSADFFGGIASRRSEPLAVATWSQAAGVPVLVIVAIVVGGELIARDLAIGALAGVGAALGVSALYIGFARSSIGIVAPTAATTAAAIPILVGLSSGERPGPVVAAGLGIGLAAILLVGYVPGDRRRAGAGVLLGIASGVGFGAMVVAYAATASESGVWSAVSGRTVAAAVAGIAVAVTRVDRRIVAAARVPTVLAGVLAAVGMAAFVTASQTAELVVLGVALGLFPTVTVLLAAVVLREPMRGSQWAGVSAAAVAVTLISLG